MTRCDGYCDNFKLDMKAFGESKYLNNYFCKTCNKWFPKSEVFMTGIYHRCPCCHMKARTKRWSSRGPRNK